MARHLIWRVIITIVLMAVGLPVEAGSKFSLSHSRKLPIETGNAVLNQCSRLAPKPGSSHFSPSDDEIADFVKKLGAKLESETLSGRWDGEFIGYERNGRRYVYGNFNNFGDHAMETDGPVIICDGGKGAFGAEYDIESGEITHLDFNGVI